MHSVLGVFTISKISAVPGIRLNNESGTEFAVITIENRHRGSRRNIWAICHFLDSFPMVKSGMKVDSNATKKGNIYSLFILK